MNTNMRSFLFATLFLLLPFMAKAEVTVEVIGSGLQQQPIAIVPFSKPANFPAKKSITKVVSADLRRSGLFRVLETRGVANQAHSAEEVIYPEWAALQAQSLTVGSIEQLPGNKLKVSFQLLDVLKQTQLIGLEYTIKPSQIRVTAHQIADAIYEKLIGEPGVFSTRITYINKRGKRYALQVADADGFNAQSIVSSKEPIISPAWSPDGSKIAYVSFEKRKPVVFIQSLVTGKRKVLANFKGNNSAPSWSPDGKKLAIVLTHGTNSQIYTVNNNGTGLRQLIKSSTIDTEPVWSADGSSIYFTSNRGGAPQIYKTSSTGGSVQRVTFEGKYNVSPRISPDGKLLAYITHNQGKYSVAIQDLATGQTQIVSEGRSDESPSFAPNSRMVIYATKIRGRGALAAVSADGRVRQRLSEGRGDLREPAWGIAAN